MFGSLFAGIGGFDLGLGRAGMDCAWQVENDAKCNDVLARHWPDVKRYGDVNDVGKELGAVDLICGGFPCQDVSVAGKGAGLAGERSGLWFQFHRILAELKPGWVVVENVPGLLSNNRGGDFAIVIRGLAELGYLSAWRVHNAQYHRVAQRRRRVFVVGHLGDGCAAEVLFEREGGTWDSPPGREAGEAVAAPIKAGAPSRRGGGSSPIADEFVVAGTLGGGSGERGWCDDLDRSGAFIPVAFGGNRTGGPIDVAAARNAHGSNRYDFESETFMVARPLAHSRTADHYDESQQTYVAQLYPTLRGQPNQGPGRMADDSAITGLVRRLTPTECERLQGFPDGWTDGQSDSARYQQLGNAVCVPVAEWIGKRILAAEAGGDDGRMGDAFLAGCQARFEHGESG